MHSVLLITQAGVAANVFLSYIYSILPFGHKLCSNYIFSAFFYHISSDSKIVPKL